MLRTKSKDVVDQCMLLFQCPSFLAIVNKRKAKFLTDYPKSCNSLCRLFGHAAQKMNWKICNVALDPQPNVAVFILLDKVFSLL